MRINARQEGIELEGCSKIEMGNFSPRAKKAVGTYLLRFLRPGIRLLAWMVRTWLASLRARGVARSFVARQGRVCLHGSADIQLRWFFVGHLHMPRCGGETPYRILTALPFTCPIRTLGKRLDIASKVLETKCPSLNHYYNSQQWSRWYCVQPEWESR